LPSSLSPHDVRHDGVTTHYLDSGADGDRPVLLLVHDGWFGADARTLWSRLAPELAADLRIVAPDMLGFGRTDKIVYFDRSMYAYRAAHLGSFVRAVCGPDVRVHAVGTSMGGSILLRDAVAAAPAIPVRSIVSVSGSGGPWRSSFGAEQLGRYAGTVDDIARVMDHMAGAFDGRDAVIAERQANTERRGHVQCLLAGTVTHPAGSAPPPPDGWPAPLRELTVPVTVVAGAQDPLLEPDWQRHLDGLSPLLATRVLDARHVPSLDHPELLAQVVRDHVRRATEPVLAHEGSR
jgi:pimeloyl-ACP methyl ester carboxylesterase